MRWVVDCIYILNPIRFTNIRRNEVKSVVSARSIQNAMTTGRRDGCIVTATDIQQRSALVLQEVRYVLEAHFEMTEHAAPSDNHGKFSDIIRRRLEKGQCYHQMYAGTREFPVHFRKWEGGQIPTIDETRDMGFMLYDLDYTNPGEIRPMFFRAMMNKGVLDVQNCEVYR